MISYELMAYSANFWLGGPSWGTWPGCVVGLRSRGAWRTLGAGSVARAVLGSIGKSKENHRKIIGNSLEIIGTLWFFLGSFGIFWLISIIIN